VEREKSATRPTGGYLEALLQACPDAVLAIDSKGIMTFANRAACVLLGCEMTDLVGKSIVTVYENDEKARETNRKLYQSGGVIHDHESHLKTKTGKLIPVRISASQLKDSSGNYTGGVGFFQPYRPWTAAEAKLEDYCRELEARLAEWQELGAPVFELYPGLSMAVVVGRLDGQRFAQLKKSLLDHIVVNKTRAALIDLSTAVSEGGEVPAQLVKMIRMVRVVGAQCMIVGIKSTAMAEAVESLVADVASLNTFSSLQAGLEAAVAVLDFEISKKS